APPPVEPFDLARCAERLARIPKPGGRADWDRAKLSPAMSADEARFWLEAMTQLGANTTTKALAVHLTRHPDFRALSRHEIASRLRRLDPHVPPEIVIPLSRLLTLEDIVGLTLSSDLLQGQAASAAQQALFQGLHHIVPCLDEAQRDELREVVRPRFEEVR